MENKLLDYDTIVHAVAGDTDAIAKVLRHFEAYIRELSKRRQTLPDGTRKTIVDEDIKLELEIELITKIRLFRIED